MFRSLGTSLISLFVVLTSGFLLLFIMKGSTSISFERVGMENDVALSEKMPTAGGTQAFEVPEDMKDDTESSMTAAATPTGGGETVVLWLSLTGFRGDYVEKSETPFFDQVIGEGFYTHKFLPIFPCLTYPSHVSQATGVSAAKHGIPSDSFRNEANGETVTRPMDPSFLKAEPIWTTATRQGIRVLVQDWPMSQNQTGEHAAAYFDKDYDPAAADQDRLNRLLDTWSSDKDPKKLRLIMARLNSLNEAGLKNGPRAEGTQEAVTATDKMLSEFFEKLKSKWSELAAPGAQLYVLMTTDHGLSELQKNINLAELLGEDLTKNVDIVASESIAHLFFKDLPEDEAARKAFIEEYDREMNNRIYWRSHPKDQLPPNWNYNYEGRVGDRVLVLKTGYAFTDVSVEGSKGLFDPAEGPGIFGAFGYPVEDSTRMAGTALFWGYPDRPRMSGDQAEINALSIYPTVCKLLGIEPAEGIEGAALEMGN